MGYVSRLVLVAVFVVIAATRWPVETHAAYGPLDVMPAISTGGGALSEFGMHFDELGSAEFGAYDYSASVDTPTWLRGTAEGDQFYSTRYKFWKENSCAVTARLQMYIGGAWYDYWQYDLHFYHIKPNVPYVSYTQAVTLAGQWFYAQIGKVDSPANCPPATGPHVHLSGDVYGSGYLLWYPKSNDTCWADSTQCDSVMSMWKRLHSTCSTWSGWTQNRSGTVSQYVCETWSVATRTDQDPAFKKN